MSQDLINKVNDAIKKSLAWSEEGWDISFGHRNTKIPTLKDATSQPDTFVNKLEAVAFWEKVKEDGEEVAEHGKKAVSALEKGDLQDASDYVYAAWYIEKFYEHYSKVWRPIYDEIAKQIAA